MSETWRMPKESRRVLQAAAVEAYGSPGMYVLREPVTQRVNISDVVAFLTIAQYLDQRGWIAEAEADYGAFVLTPEGIDEATN